MKELSDQTEIFEFTISQTPLDIVEKILSISPKIVGFGVYIWNTDEILVVIKHLKQLAPEIIIVLGGPEISYETESQAHINYSNFIIKGEADFSFYKLCSNILNNTPSAELKKIHQSPLPEINNIQMPYFLYTDEDIKNRVLYVEASRGCPYKCEYCLSSLDVSVRNFSIAPFLENMQMLIDRGAKQFKFVDRTFNLSPSISENILLFFLNQIDKGLFLHFEMVPDRLPDNLKQLIKRFPSGSLQFEIGIQTLNETVSALISRRQNVSKMQDNFFFLRNETHVHTHADLIVGLPGETLNSFKLGFDRLIEMDPDEIQVGILKRLKGTPIARHQNSFEMIYSETSPYQILKTKDLNFIEIQKMNRFSRYWDMIANSGQFNLTMNFFKSYTKSNALSFFEQFFKLSEFLYSRHRGTFAISLVNIAESVFRYLIDELKLTESECAPIIYRDFCTRKKRDIPEFLKPYFKVTRNDRTDPSTHMIITQNTPLEVNKTSHRKRQLTHTTTIIE